MRRASERPIDSMERLASEYRKGLLTEVETLYYMNEVIRQEEDTRRAERMAERVARRGVTA